MKLKLFILTAVLSGILAVSASAEVTNTGATGRDIRFAGYGNTTSGWNSVTEFGVYK